MNHRINAQHARTRLGKIIDLAVKNNDRFVVDRRDEPAVVIMSVRDFISMAAPPPDWLEKAWKGARQRGIDTLTLDDVEDDIRAHRTEQPTSEPGVA